MKEISCQELIQLTDGYSGKNVELSLSPIQLRSIYQKFKCRDIGNEIEFWDFQIGKVLNELTISKDDIEKIICSGENDIYKSVFTIVLHNGNKIDLTVCESPVKCYKCGLILEKYYQPVWHINQVGQYGSQWDNERMVVDICDDCLLEFLL
jgi:hypothetical protein